MKMFRGPRSFWDSFGIKTGEPSASFRGLPPEDEYPPPPRQATPCLGPGPRPRSSTMCLMGVLLIRLPTILSPHQPPSEMLSHSTANVNIYTKARRQINIIYVQYIFNGKFCAKVENGGNIGFGISFGRRSSHLFS